MEMRKPAGLAKWTPGHRLQQAAELTAAARDLLTSPFFPGLEIPLFEIFL